MQQARTSLTCALKGWNGLLSKIRNLFFKASKALSTMTLSEECLKLNNSLALVGWFLLSYLDRLYLTPCREGGSHYGSISCIYKVEFTYKCTRDALGECLWHGKDKSVVDSWFQLPSGTMNPSFLSMATARMRASCVEPSQPASTYVNLRSKSTTAITFYVGFDFLPLKSRCMCLGTLAKTWVPSMAPM